MNILCIDTSFFTGAVGVMKDSSLLMSVSFNVQATYSEKLLYMIDLVCKETNIPLNSMDLIAVARGPGSFTGLRIGMTAAKSIAYALSLPITGVDTLATVMHSSRIPGNFYVPLHDARKNQVYAAVYSADPQGLHEVVPSASYEPQAIVECIEKITRIEDCVLITDGSDVAQTVLDMLPSHRYVYSPFLPDMYAVGRIGMQQFSNGQNADVRSLEPLYGRLSDAEIQYEKRNSLNS